MSVCVNTNSKEFKDTAKRLDISESSLENIVHEYMNTEGNVNSFPSDSYILSKVTGEPLTEISEKAQKLIDLKYSRPFVVDTYEEARAIANEMSQYFDPKHIGIKENHSGKYEVSLAAMKTLIKEQYKGKLIFAQSGTGKTSIADNVNLIDSDYLLGQILGVPTSLAGDAFKLLGFNEKREIGAKYRELIRQKIAEGKTVVTANLSMMSEADVIVYNESAELSNARTSAEDRANQFTNNEYQIESLNRINEFLAQNPNTEAHKLGAGQFLSSVILNDPNFNVFTDRVQNNTLNNMLNDFVHNFGINIEEYQGDIPLFNAVDRVIKARSAEDLPDAVGEAVAFMMQYNPDVKNYIAERVVEDGKFTREQMFDSKGRVKHIYNTTPFAPVKADYFKEVGKEIAKQLRRLYAEANNIHTEEIKDPFIKRIWNIISEFFNKILPRKEMVSSLSLAQERLTNYAKKTARGILSNNEGLIIASLSKPGEKGEAKLATPVNVYEAFKNNPYERSIIEKMTSEGIQLAGSTSIAIYGRVLRPAENPFHDLDFASPNWTAAQLEDMLKRQFTNYQSTNVISDDSGEVTTRSYVILNRPFSIEPSKLGESFFRLVDNETGEVLGSLNGKKTEFVSLSEGVEGKVLDFFVTPDKYAPLTYNYNGVDYLISNPKNALDAKISWMRLKDIFDFNRAIMNDFTPTELPLALREYSSEMQEIKDAAISNGTFMKAPNGKSTNLTERQWLQVRTKAFKDWFGDWERASEFNTSSSINKFNISAIDTSRVDIKEVDKAWRSDPNRKNKTLRIYIKDQHNKGYFELVKDEEFGQYSVHFKTSKEGAKYNAENTDFTTKEERKILFEELVKAIPEGAIVSTWGSLSEDGVRGLNNVGRDMLQIGTREVTLKSNGDSFKIPIYRKGSVVSQVVDNNGEPLVVYHGSSKKFREFASKYTIGEDSGFFFSSDRKYAEQFGQEMYPVFLNMRTPMVAGDIPLHRDTLYSIFAESQESVDYMNAADGIIGNDIPDGKLTPSTGFEFMVYKPNQIKSATENSGEFDAQTNDIYYNIEGKSLREFLRDKGLIHTYDPSLGNTDAKAMYVTKGDGTYSMKSIINEIYTTLRMNGISPTAVSFERTKEGNAMRVIFNNREDAILKERNKKLADIKKTVDFLQARIPALKGRVHYATIEEAENALGRKLKANENSFVKNGQVYLIGRRFTQDIAIEECLHPFTATLKYENPFLYNRLLAEARETFPKLWEDIVSNYSNKDFSVADRENELITQALARNFREVYNTTEESQRKTFVQYAKQFINWFRNLFYRVNPMTGNQIIDLDTIKPDMTFRELAELINTSDTEFSVGFEEKTRFNKERLQISDYEKEFITESIVLPGVSSETLKKVSVLWDDTFSSENSPYEEVTIPLSTWSSLAVDSPVHVGKDVSDAAKASDKMASQTSVPSLNILSELYESEYEEPFEFNNRTVTLPRSALNVAKIAKEISNNSEEYASFMDAVYAALRSSNLNLDASIISDVEAIQFIMDEMENFGDFLSLVGGEFYYSDSRQGLLFDEEGNPTEDARVDEDGLSVVKPVEVRPELSKFQDATSKMITQLNNLLDSDLMSNTEVRHVAEQAVYFLSDSITDFLENPSRVFEIFPELGVKEGKPMTAEEQQKEIERIKGMSRVELAKYLTPERLIEFTKARLFSPEGNPNINNRKLIKKAQLIRDNFDAIIRFANDAFAIVEDFAITSVDNKLSIVEDMVPTTEDYNNTNDAATILENEGSLQEHWQIESRTLDIMSLMSQLVKQALNKCFQIRINPETGVEEYVLSEFGIAERMNAKDATASILRWTRGAESLSHMLQILDSKSAENPWVKQITDRLKDNSGNEADFQSQFYGVFAKAFQPYSIILREKNSKTNEYEYKSIQVNQHPALTDAVQAIEVAFKTNNHPLFDNMKIRKDSLDTLTAITDTLFEKAKNKLEENDRAEIVDLILKAATALGHTTDANLVNLALDSNATFNTLVNKLKAISANLNAALTKENYDPFKFKGENSIGGYLRDFLKPLTEKLEETAVSSFYDSGKMYQSYVTPSYLTVMMNHFTSEDARFQEWLDTEYGQYAWFKNSDGSWRNVWLETLDGMPLESTPSQTGRKDLFKHKVQLNFNKHNYMKNMSDVEYALSIISEYFSEFNNAKGNTVPVWYRVPMMSNKPSSEFLRMYAYTGAFMKPKLVDGFSRIFQQELSRIQTVDIRDYDKKNPNFIKNFDKNGKKFMMLDFFNKYLENGSSRNTELGNLINKAIKEGTASLTSEENSKMSQLVAKEIQTSMDAKADAIITSWKSNGIFEGAKQIANVGKEDAAVETKLREFVWNDTFAAMNILELTITDPAFYKDAEDLQKRLAQIHAPGIRANVEATDYSGKRVTDGKFRTILLKDFDDFVSNIKDNLRIVFDRKLKELENSGVSKEDGKYRAAAATYENIIEQFNYINVADAQGYSSPTSYRKKAFIFGKWSRKSEEIYNKLKEGKYTYNDLQTAFQPLKPFVYGQISKPGIDVARRDIATPLTNLKVPVQFKNSEYLLIMADAILQGEDTGKPNLLRAIYEVMEESAEKDSTKGIDTIQFESTCKSGLMAAIDIKQFYNVKGGETMAKLALTQAIYNEDGSYNTDTYVYEVPFENYAIQQEVPEHFKDHYQAHGSQIRYIIPSDLESVNSEGEVVTYNYFDRGEEKRLTAEEFKAEYEENIALNINASIEDLAAQLGIGNDFISKKDRNIALSNILLKEVLSSPRYGAELAAACTVNSETGEFNIPLGDPIQAKRIEQLINSIIKNRINKQEIAGGPVVQVTNFGTSRELNIRFKDKDGNLLKTRAEWDKERQKPTGVNSTFATVAPYYNTRITNENKEDITRAVERDFKEQANRIAKSLGLSIKGIFTNTGGFQFQEGKTAGQQVRELSYTFEFNTLDTEKVDMFASLLGDLGHERQESVISYNAVDTAEEADALAFKISVNDIKGVADLIEQSGFTDYTLNESSKEITILAFSKDAQEFGDKFDVLINNLGNNYNGTEREYIQSRYLDSTARREAYETWSKTREVSARENQSLYSEEQGTEEIANTVLSNIDVLNDEDYKRYIKENQAGIAYYEVFAPIFSNELFEKFADKNGNIDIEVIEKINPDLLKMIGYRIPTEDKYSMAPLKIVGFLPREAGDGIMLPNDITLLTGSDFDVDKFYLMRKESSIIMRQLGPESTNVENFDQAAREYTKNHREILEKHLKNYIYQNSSKAPFNQAIFLTEEEESEATERATKRTDYRRYAENKRHESVIANINRGREHADKNAERRAQENKFSESQEARVYDQFDKAIERENAYHQRKLNSIEADAADSVSEGLKKAQERKINNIIRDFLESPLSKQSDPMLKALRDEYIKYMFDYVEPTEGTTYRNNKIVDMSWAVLTNETTASKMLNPGGFEPQKRMGYLISAYQNPSVHMTWEQLNDVTSIDELKDLCYTDKNLCFIDTHLQFYKQNSAAATALGMAAVQKVAHAVLESNGFRINVSDALGFEEDEFFSIAGKDFMGEMEIDSKYDDEGNLIGRTLGEFVAMFADAVKDPVANLMNINNTTMPIVTTLIRLGMPFEKVALFISQPIIKTVLSLYNSENVTNFVRLSDVINKVLTSIEKDYHIEKDSVLKELNSLSEEEMTKNLRRVEGETNMQEAVVTDYKVLRFFRYITSISEALKGPTLATRFNSISNAVGPLIIDNLIMEYQVKSRDFENLYDKDGNRADFDTILEKHPILKSFYATLNIGRELFEDMPANSTNFRDMLDRTNDDLKKVLYGDRKLLGELSDFYQSYLLVASGVVPAEATQDHPHQGLKYYIEKFPSDFIRGRAKEVFKGNPLIDAIKLDIQKGRAVLKIDTTGLTTQDKERLGDGWTDLYRSGERGRKLAEHLFYYNFWRTGIGFSPKSFMGLFPTRLKSKIPGYNEAFTVHNTSFARNVVGNQVLSQFVRNNADNNKLVPKVAIGNKGTNPTIENGLYTFKGEDYGAVNDKFYIKIKSGNRTILLERVSKDTKGRSVSFKELSLLGNNGEYFEASTDVMYQPLSETTETKEQINDGQMQEVSPAEVQSGDTPVKSQEPTEEEQFKRATKIKNMLLKMFMMSGRNEVEAQRKLDEFKAKSEDEKAKLKGPMKKFIANKFEQLGIKYNEKLLDEMYENLC